MSHQSNQPICPCGKPMTNGATLCSACRRTTHHAIANTAVHYDDLDTLRTGRTRYGMPAKGSIGKSRPLGMDERFIPGGRGARAQTATRAAAVRWAGKLMATRPGDGPEHDSVRSVCAYLDRNLAVIATQDWAADFKADMLSLERTLADLVDRPPESWYAGECGAILGSHGEETCACACHRDSHLCDVGGDDGGGDCGRDADEVTCTRVLYAEPGKTYVRCRDCRTEWPVQERRDILLREAEDRLVTVRTLARVVTTLGAPGTNGVSEAKLENRINVWVHRRKRLHAIGSRVVDGKVRPTYRVGDVLDLLARDIEADTEQRETRREKASKQAS